MKKKHNRNLYFHELPRRMNRETGELNKSKSVIENKF